MVLQSDSSTTEAEAGGWVFVGLKPVWSIQQVPDQPGLLSKRPISSKENRKQPNQDPKQSLNDVKERLVKSSAPLKTHPHLVQRTRKWVLR